MRQFLLNNIQLLMVFAFVGFSAFSWLMRTLAEKAQKRRMETERERRHLESLRTGRASEEAPAPAAASPEQRLAEIAARRERMRQAAQQKATPPVPPTGSTSAGPISAQRGATMQVPTQVRQTQAAATSSHAAQAHLEEIQAKRRAEVTRQQKSQHQQSQQRHQQVQQRAQQQLQQQQAQLQRQRAQAQQKVKSVLRGALGRAQQKAEIESFDPGESTTGSISLSEMVDVHKHMKADNASAFDQPQQQVSKVSAAMTRDSLRQAIVLNEVLSQPLSLREPPTSL
jgi:hypothetical protein